MKEFRFKSIFEILFVLLVSLQISCDTDNGPDLNPPVNPPTTDGDWNLVFQDEFENLGLWNIWYGGAFNNEIQLYRPEQLELGGGILKIHAEREAVSGPPTPFDVGSKNFEYVSGRIESNQLFGPSAAAGENEYRFVARIKLPEGHGMWPAFWTYGDPWPTQGEIDILEARGNETTKFQSNIFYGPNTGVNINSNTEAFFDTGIDLTADFHIYEMIWKQNSIEIYFDEELLHTYTANDTNNIASLFGKKQKLVFNTAVGGWFIQDQNSVNYADESTMEVDWVRVYKK